MEDIVHVIGVTVHPKTAEDAAKLRAALPRLADEDSTIVYRIDPDPERARLVGTSETHLEMTIDRLMRAFAVQVSLGNLEISYRETIMRTVEYEYTHKKITDSGGEFARVKIRFEPLPRGNGLAFVNAADNRLPSEYAAAVGEGLRTAARRGGVHCYPTIDFIATLIDGAYYDTDSNAQIFETAGSACFRKAMAKAGPQLLEPIMKVTVLTPEEYMGYVVGDLNGRGGTITGMSPGTMHAIDALVPLRHMLGYASRLRAMTKGRASWTTQFDHYAPYWGGDDLDPVHPGAAIGLR
jgi:elongation factor G